MSVLQKVLEYYSLGTQVVWSGVTSMSRNETVACEEFAGPGGVVFRIRACSAVCVENFSVFAESEVQPP